MPLEELIHVACVEKGCGHTVCMTPATNGELRRTHDWFYCPAGHPMRYTGPTAVEEERDDLRKRLDHAQQRLSEWRGYYHRELVEQKRLRRLSRTCPLCDEVMPRTRARLYRHLQEVHNAQVDVEVEA
jgi:hypothetical protein